MIPAHAISNKSSAATVVVRMPGGTVYEAPAGMDWQAAWEWAAHKVPYMHIRTFVELYRASDRGRK